MSQAIRSQGSYLQRGAATVVTPQTISTITAVSSLATVTTAAAHTLAIGSVVTLSGAVPAAYNGQFLVASVPTATTFTLTTLTAAGGPATTVGAYTANNIAYAVVEEASSIKMGGVSVSSIDVTHLLSTAKEFLAGIQDNGSLDVTCNFINGTVQTLIRADMNGGVTSPYQIVIPNGATKIYISFSAFVTKYAGPDPKNDSKLEISLAFKITGATSVVNQ